MFSSLLAHIININPQRMCCLIKKIGTYKVAGNSGVCLYIVMIVRSIWVNLLLTLSDTTNTESITLLK